MKRWEKSRWRISTRLRRRRDAWRMQQRYGSKKTKLVIKTRDVVTSLTLHIFIGFILFISMRTMLTRAAAVTERQRETESKQEVQRKSTKAQDLYFHPTHPLESEWKEWVWVSEKKKVCDSCAVLWMTQTYANTAHGEARTLATNNVNMKRLCSYMLH